MALLVNATMTGDCKSIIINLVGTHPGAVYKASIENVDSGVSIQGVIPADADSYAFTGLTSGGVYRVDVTDTKGVVTTRFIVSTCAVDKCLVLLTDKLLSCGCSDPACAALMDKAQKVMLLVKSAEATAERIMKVEDHLLVSDANSQYQKAVQVCEGNCDCGC